MGNIWAKLFKRQAPIKKNMLELLPPEMHSLVLSHLDTLSIISQTSKHQRSAAKQHKRSRANALFEACFGKELKLQADGSRMARCEFPVKHDGVLRPTLSIMCARIHPEKFIISFTEAHRFYRFGAADPYEDIKFQFWFIPSCGKDGSVFLDEARLAVRALAFAGQRTTHINGMVGIYEGRKVE